MSKIIPVGEYIFNETITDLPTFNRYDLQVSNGYYVQNVGYGVGLNSGLNPTVWAQKSMGTGRSEIFINFGRINVNDIGYFFATTCTNSPELPADYWWYTAQDSTKIQPVNDEQKEKLRTISIEEENTVDDDFYAWFNNNATLKEEEPIVQLLAPYLEVDNNFIRCYCDSKATNIRFYKQNEDLQYEFFASSPVINSFAKIPMNEYITAENTSFTIKAYCEDSTGNYFDSEWSNIVTIRREKNTYLNVIIKGGSGLTKSKISLIADNVLYEQEKNYIGEDIVFSFIIASFNKKYISTSFEISNIADTGYHILDGDKINYKNSLQYNTTTNLTYNVEPITDVPSYSFFLYTSSGEEINEYISTQKIIKIDLQEKDTIKLVYVDHELTIKHFLLDNTTFIGIDKSLDNVNPEYKVFNTYDVNISSTVRYYVCVSSPENVLIYLFNNKAENNRLDKSSYLENVDELHGNLREECNIIDPIINIEMNNPPSFNYVYIPSFNRYYFVKEFDFVRTGLYRLKLHVDVLMSYKDGIKNLECLIERNEYKYNKFIPTRIPTKNNIEIKEYVVELPEVTNRALFTIYDTSRRGYHLSNKNYYGDCNIVIQLLATE